MLGHNWAEATCLAPKTCTRCSKTDGGALGHDEITEVIEPTCIEQGITNVTCSRCDYFSVKNPVDELGHDISYRLAKDSTCAEEGVELVSCSRCVYETTRAIEKKPHSEKYDVVPPTCEADGITNISCENCDYTSTKDPMEKLGHDTTDNVLETPDCFNGGLKETTCSRCSYRLETVLEKLGHDVIDMSKEPTCTEDGCSKFACSRCDYVESESLIVTTGHTFSLNGTCARCFEAKPIVLAEQVESVTASHEGGGAPYTDKLFDGDKSTTGIYGGNGVEYYPEKVGDTLTIVLKQEIYTNELCLWVCGNWSLVDIYFYDAEGNQTGQALGVVYHGAQYDTASVPAYVTLNENIKFNTMVIKATNLKWDSGKTEKLSEIEIFLNEADTLPLPSEETPEETPVE